MLTQIVVLFMVTQLNMPTWCKNLVLIAIGLNVLRFLYGLYKVGKEQGEQDAKS
mgnify:CR=1 FL=1